MLKFIKLILSILIIVISNPVLNAQGGAFDPVKFKESMANASFREKLEAANLLIEDKLYTFAADILVELCKEQPDNANVNYKAGMCLLQLSNRRTEALPYLKAAESKISPKYNPFNVLETSAPIETYYYLARAYHLTEKIDQAETSYNSFLEKTTKKHILFADAELGLKQCAIARPALANKLPYKISNAGSINSAFNEYAPVITPDESIMFFTSRRLRPDSSNNGIFSPQDGMYYEDIYVSYKDFKTGQWSEPEVLSKVSSVNSNQASISVTNDGQTLFIYKDVNGDGQIHYAQYEAQKETYGAAKLFAPESDINSKNWETHITVSPNNDLLYFVSDRPGGLGGRDIYVSRKLPNGQWSLAQNLGAPINTPYDEDAPFFHPDGKTLYFSSNGDQSMGGFDIFFTQLNEEGKWDAPINFGYDLNTCDDDIFFMTNASGKTGYFTGLHGDTKGEKDLYTVNLVKTPDIKFAILKGYIDPGPGKTVPDGILILLTDITEGGDPREFSPNKRNGSYIFNVTPCHEYEVEYLLNDVAFYQTEFKVPCDVDYNETEIVLSLDGIRLDGNDAAPVDTTSNVTTPILGSDSLPAGDRTKWKYQILANDKPFMSKELVQFFEDNNLVFSEYVDENGFFKYHEIEGKDGLMKVLNLEDVTLCKTLKLRLLDENGNLIRETTRDIRCKTEVVTYSPPVEFKKFYGYNVKGINKEEDNLDAFILAAKKMIEEKGYVQLEVTGSASTVPTKTFKDNKNLAKNRSDAGIEYIKNALMKEGVKEDQIKIIAVKSVVQGPKYTGDFKNTEKYGPYQYIEIKAK